MSKVFTVRLSSDQVAELTSLATFDGVAIAEEIREAITMLLKSRSKDPAFAERVRDAYENAKKVLANLERGEEVISALGKPTFVGIEDDPVNPVKAAAASSATRMAGTPNPAPRALVAAGRGRSRG